MIRDITIGQYYSGSSVIHRMDARMKIVLTLAYIVSIFICRNFISLGVMALFVAVTALFSRVPVKMLLKSLKPVLIIVLFTAVLNIFYTTGGSTLVEWRFIKITSKGVFSAIFMSIRIIALIVCSSLLTYTTTPTVLTGAIESLLSPLKIFHIKVNTFAMMLTLALRFVPTLIEEIDRIMNAQKARGADLESGGLISRARALVPILIPLFISSFRRAYDLAFAMECRCYTGGDNRTSMKKMKLAGRDFGALVFYLIMLAGIIVVNRLFPAVI